jgi:hypothetical protein
MARRKGSKIQKSSLKASTFYLAFSSESRITDFLLKVKFCELFRTYSGEDLSEPPEGQGGGPDIIGGGGCGRSSKGSSGDTSYDISAPSGHASNDSEIEMLNQGRGHFVCVSQRELRRAPPCRKQVVLTRPQNYHRLQLCMNQRVLNDL